MPFQSTEQLRYERNAVNLNWLLKLRWASIFGQIGTILVVYRLIGIAVPLAPLTGVLAIETVSNVLVALWFARGPRVREWHVAGVMALDIALLTGLLYYTGGPSNPFSSLYLVNIALAAVALRAQWTWALVALALLSFGALPLSDYWPLALGHLDATEQVELLQKGRWVAFGVAATFIVHFLWRVTGALKHRERELWSTRTQAARQEQLASLATVAAGAAHELSTPLATIALVAKELERDMPVGSRNREDIDLVRAEVARCRTILDQMAGGAASDRAMRFEEMTVADLLERTRDGVRERPTVYFDASDVTRASELRMPGNAVAQALRSLVTNAQDASEEDSPVWLRASVETDAGTGRWLFIEVADSGQGMDQGQLARASEPFFTTKEPGSGMGLGLYLTRAVIEKLGGEFEMTSDAGIGTRVRVKLPLFPGVPSVAADDNTGASYAS